MQIKKLLPVLLALGLTVHPAGAVQAAAVQPPDAAYVQQAETARQDFAAQTAERINRERAARGLPRLTVRQDLNGAAQVRARESAQRFSHTRPNGASFATVLAERAVSYRGAGENIAYGQSTPQQVVSAWMRSPGHRANILSTRYTAVGTGCVWVNGTPYWAQIFTY